MHLSDVFDAAAAAAAEVGAYLFVLEELAPGEFQTTWKGPGRDALLGGPGPLDTTDNDWESCIHAADRPIWQAVQDDIRAGRVVDVEYRVVGHDGRVRWLLDRSHQVDRRNGLARRAGIVLDITERKNLAEALAKSTVQDRLTGLPNRELVANLLEKMLEQRRCIGGRVAVILLDLDRFGLINETRGHLTGDRVLREVAGRLVAATTHADLVARFSGDAFVIVRECGGGEGASIEVADLASIVQTTIAAPILTELNPVYITASIGVAHAHETSTAHTLLGDADAAMRAAKQTGDAGLAEFDETGRRKVVEQVALSQALRSSLSSNDFTLAYQPIIDLATGRLCRFEALLRWRGPDGVPVAPATFIPLAERTGLIVPIGEWVAREACRQLAIWHGSGALADAPVSINVAPAQLLQSDFPSFLKDCLDEYGVDPSKIGIEVTESISDNDGFETAIARARACGVSLLLDDFGAGHSSLTRLRSLRPDILKLDRSFVNGLGTEHIDTAIVAAAIGLARALNIAVVAEGIETAAQAAALQLLECEYGQGFHFSKALPPDELAARVGSDGMWLVNSEGGISNRLRAPRRPATTSAGQVAWIDRQRMTSGQRTGHRGSGRLGPPQP